MLHGITMSGRTWEWVVADLADRYRVIRLDFRGHGRSDRAPGAYQPADYLSDAVATIEQVAGGPCFVVGHSLGGMTAAALTQQRPDLVRGAVLEDPPLGSPARTLDDNSLLDGFALMRESVPRLQGSGNPPGGARRDPGQGAVAGRAAVRRAAARRRARRDGRLDAAPRRHRARRRRRRPDGTGLRPRARHPRAGARRRRRPGVARRGRPPGRCRAPRRPSRRTSTSRWSRAPATCCTTSCCTATTSAASCCFLAAQPARPGPSGLPSRTIRRAAAQSTGSGGDRTACPAVTDRLLGAAPPKEIRPPPSSTSVWPVIHVAPAARYSAASPMSSGSPRRCSG